jgi:hypothetical protein
MPTIDGFLLKLEGVKRSTADAFIARCPAHNDKSPSLALRELPDGRILFHCFAGCSPEAVLSAVGLTFADVMPEKYQGHTSPLRRPFPAEAILECVAHEAMIARICAADLAQGIALGDEDRKRMGVAGNRLHEAVEMIRARS